MEERLRKEKLGNAGVIKFTFGFTWTGNCQIRAGSTIVVFGGFQAKHGAAA